MNERLTGSLVEAVVSAVVAIVSAAIFVGQLDARMDRAESWIEAEPARVEQVIEVFASAPRPPGDEQGFTNDGRWGRWSDPVYCPAGQYVCGLRQRVEEDRGNGDDSAMNAIRFYCCSLAP